VSCLAENKSYTQVRIYPPMAWSLHKYALPSIRGLADIQLVGGMGEVMATFNEFLPLDKAFYKADI
jgi:hypothetical protein